MTVKNYYAVLGVRRDESPGGIRNAYRGLARLHHPDRAGPGSTRRFQDITEAYAVLSDPVRRESHDRDLVVDRPTRRETSRWARASSAPSVAPIDAAGLDREAPLTLEVILSPDEAVGGAVARVPFPGAGRPAFMTLYVAPGARDRTVVDVPIRGRRTVHPFVRLLIRVAPA